MLLIVIENARQEDLCNTLIEQKLSYITRVEGWGLRGEGHQ